MFPVALVLLLLTAACDQAAVAVRVTIPDLDGVETPVPNVVLTFLPYDRDSVVRGLEAKAGPRPHTAALDSLFGAFRLPFLTYLRLAADVERLRAAEASLAQGASPTDSRLAGVRDSLAALGPRLERARDDLERARADLWPPIDSLRREVDRWEDSALGGYDTLVQRIRERAFANPVADTTDPTGWAAIRLPNGPWWVTARAIDPRDPNAEWYWNVPVEGDTVRLDPRSGRNRPRY